MVGLKIKDTVKSIRLGVAGKDMWESRHKHGEEFDSMFQTLSDGTYHVLLVKPHTATKVSISSAKVVLIEPKIFQRT
ncbi:unnamed protein product [Gulo gulo]|uniref:Uncharacterized protein n=1 Tax=Gulo gulo TaxID=48420 RepID=A0A9X9LYY2_GULGU|nr:unnamed protein product [Gulo gulo]